MTAYDSKILINVEDDETRIALLKGPNLENLYVEQTNRTQKIGNIYCGKVVKIQPSFQAAFVDYGEQRHGFLSISDINFHVHKPIREGRGRISISQVLKTGQKILVQVIKDEIAHKGASLTTNISLAGRFIVFMPDSDRGGVSKKIEDEEQRTRLRHLLKGLGNENSSAIIRTVGVDRSLTELKRDYTILRRTWVEIKKEHDLKSNPRLLFQEEDAVLRMIRDYHNDSVKEVLIDEPVTFQKALEFFQTHLTKEQKKIKLYLGEKSLFTNNGIEQQIEILEHQQVPLPSGGSLVIMPTEALVAIDVNSGKSAQEKNIEATALRTNLEAAEEISRQLRLRNLGGLIVIDFIDMDNSKNRLLVEQKIEESMAMDKAKTSFGTISKFGLLELSRQRISSSLSNNSSIITYANRILRKIHDSVIEKKVLQVHLRLPIDLSTHLLNEKRQRLTQMEMDYGIRISITPDTLLEPQQIPEMGITLQEIGGLETQTSVSISASEILDEKHTPKKQQVKKIVEKKENIDDAIINSENKTEEKTSNIIETKKSHTSRKDKTKTSQKDKNQKQGMLNSEIVEEKNKSEKTSKIKLLKEKKQKENIKEEVSEPSGTIFMSTHEPASPNKQGLNHNSSLEKIPENKDYNSSNYESNHIENDDKLKSNTDSVSKEKLTEVLTNGIPMFSSVHLEDKKNTRTIESKTEKPVQKESSSKKKTPKTPSKKKNVNSYKKTPEKTKNAVSRNLSAKKKIQKKSVAKSKFNDETNDFISETKTKIKKSKIHNKSTKSSKTKDPAA